MDLAEIRKKANRDREDAAVAADHHRPVYIEAPETVEALEPDDGGFAGQDAFLEDGAAEDEQDWNFGEEPVSHAIPEEASTMYTIDEEPEQVEPPEILLTPPAISMPAIPASAATVFSASFPETSGPENIPVTGIEEFAGQEPDETCGNVFDPLAILMAGRAAFGYGDDLSIASDEGAETEIADYREFLCFRICDEQYAINIMEIKEIIKPRQITEVPRVPDFISGVLSLRGIIIPVFNMRKRLHLESAVIGARERILVVSKGEELFGILVDEVLQMVRIPDEGIEQPPAVLEGIDRDFVQGIGRYGGGMLILLNLGSILDVSLF